MDTNPQLEEVAPNIYSYVQPDGTWFINNCGFIVTGDQPDDQVIAIDATSTESRTRAYIEAIASVTDRPTKVLVNTHHHGDHTHGNYLFEDAVIISHHSCAEVMLANGIADYSALFPGVSWGELRFRAPDLTFADRMVLHTAAVGPVELTHVGFVAHTEGDVVAWVPESGVLFCGDLIFHGGTPFVLFGSIQGTLDALDVIEGFGAEVIVPGHGPAFAKAQTPEVLDSQRGYLRMVQRSAAQGMAASRSPLEQAQETELGEFASLTDSERLAGNLHVAYREAGAAAGTDPAAAAPTADRAAFVAQAIGDMVAYNGGQLPRCVA